MVEYCEIAKSHHGSIPSDVILHEYTKWCQHSDGHMRFLSTVVYTGSFQRSFTLAPFNGRLHWLISTVVYTGSFQRSFTQAPFNSHLRLFPTIIWGSFQRSFEALSNGRLRLLSLSSGHLFALFQQSFVLSFNGRWTLLSEVTLLVLGTFTPLVFTSRTVIMSEEPRL